MIENAYRALAVLAMSVLVALTLFSLLRCIRGPRISDRVLAVNMIGTLTLLMVAVCVVLYGEGYLADIALVYAMLSFLSVIVLCKVYTGVYREHKQEERLLRGADAEREGGEK